MHYKVKTDNLVNKSNAKTTIFLKRVEEHKGEKACPNGISKCSKELNTQLTRIAGVKEALV